MPKKWASFPFLLPEPQPAGSKNSRWQGTVVVLPVGPAKSWAAPAINISSSGQRAGWAAGSSGVRQGQVRRAGGGQGPVGFEQAVQAPFTGSKSASYVGDAFLFTWIWLILLLWPKLACPPEKWPVRSIRCEGQCGTGKSQVPPLVLSSPLRPRGP